METPQNFEAFAIIELFGHNKLAGKCTEQNVAGTNFLRVDVPKTSLHPPYSRLLNHAAIYAINPVTEEVSSAFAEKIQVATLTAWDIREHNVMAKKMDEDQKLLSQQIQNEIEEDDSHDLR